LGWEEMNDFEWQLRPRRMDEAAPRTGIPSRGRQNTNKPISEAKKHSIEEGLDSVTD